MDGQGKRSSTERSSPGAVQHRSRFVWRALAPRSLGLPVGALCLALPLWELGRPLWVWGLLFLFVFVWPWLALALMFLLAVAVPATALARFYARLDAIHQHVSRGDIASAKQEIDAAAGFYDRLRAVGLQRLADSYLFKGAFLQRAAHAYLIGDFQTVVQDLSAHVDDGRAAGEHGVSAPTGSGRGP